LNSTIWASCLSVTAFRTIVPLRTVSFAGKRIEGVGIITPHPSSAAVQQFSNGPTLVCQSSCHRGRNTQTQMHATEIVASEMQSNRSFSEAAKIAG
jgi:hypothetical protein